VTVSRRELLKLAAAGAVVPLLPDATAAAPAATAARAGRFLSAAEMALLDELTELIIPKDDHSGGARAAGVAHYIDGRLADYDPAIAPLREAREKWTNGLKAVDALSRAASGKPFLESTPAERTALLEQLAKPGSELPPEQPQDRGQPATEKPETIGQRFFVELKAWTVRGYYTSKVGIHDEMEYKGNTMLQDFAGTDAATLPRIVPQED
jgi:gluconate 2-dehydrogenase gamma chain